MAESIVLDASAWLAVLLGERNSGPLARLLEEKQLWAPELVRTETANGLLYAQRAGRLGFKKDSFLQMFELVQTFPVRILPLELWGKKAAEVAQKTSLTFYDAAYIAAAIVLDVPILTLDEKVRKLAHSQKVRLVL